MTAGAAGCRMVVRTIREIAKRIRRIRRCGHPMIWHVSGSGTVIVLGMAAALLGGCAISAEPPMPTSVFLLGSEMLDSPVVSAPGVFKLGNLAAISDDNVVAGRAAGFFVTIGSRDAQAVAMRLVDLDTSAVSSFERIPSPVTASERTLGLNAHPFSAQSRQLLTEGMGVFWIATGDGEDNGVAAAGSVQDRFGVLIPEALLTPFTRVEVFTDVLADGTPYAPATFELVQDFFYMAVIGDSVQWGNGLREPDKMSSLAAATIERETGRKVVMQRYAQSGARILPADGDSICEVNCVGEVPTASTSITVQADLIQSPELVEFVLMDGCINDVEVGAILDSAVPEEELADRTSQFCGEEMTTLLRKVRGIAPSSRIVVTGYYHLVGDESDLFGMLQWSVTQEVEQAEDDQEAEEGTWVDTLARRSTLFVETAHAGLVEAVDRINAEANGEAVAAFADAGIGPEHAVFTEDRWLWSMAVETDLLGDLNVGLELFPEDPLQEFRASNCLEPDVVYDFLFCLYDSVGHPNVEGARAYADAIVEVLRSLHVLPAGAP